MTLGAFAAIGQRNFKRLMAYSSIGHMGYALVGLAAGTVEGAQSVIIYMAIYVVMTLGTFAAILSMRRAGRAVETMADLAGLGRTDPVMAFFLATMMFSLAGVPPLAGLLRQVLCLRGRHQGPVLPAFGYRRAGERGCGLVLSSGSWLTVFRRTGPGVRPPGRRRASIVLAVSALAIILFVVLPSPITNAAMRRAVSF